MPPGISNIATCHAQRYGVAGKKLALYDRLYDCDKVGPKDGVDEGDSLTSSSASVGP